MAEILTFGNALKLEPSEQKKAQRSKYQEMVNEILCHVVNTAILSGRPKTLELLGDILNSAPLYRANLSNPEWVAQSTCMECLKEAEKNFQNEIISEESFFELSRFWFQVFIDYGRDCEYLGNVGEKKREDFYFRLQARKYIMEVFSVLYDSGIPL